LRPASFAFSLPGSKLLDEALPPWEAILRCWYVSSVTNARRKYGKCVPAFRRPWKRSHRCVRLHHPFWRCFELLPWGVGEVAGIGVVGHSDSGALNQRIWNRVLFGDSSTLNLLMKVCCKAVDAGTCALFRRVYMSPSRVPRTVSVVSFSSQR
jgi:hypothetical protein